MGGCDVGGDCDDRGNRYDGDVDDGHGDDGICDGVRGCDFLGGDGDDNNGDDDGGGDDDGDDDCEMTMMRVIVIM